MTTRGFRHWSPGGVEVGEFNIVWVRGTIERINLVGCTSQEKRTEIFAVFGSTGISVIGIMDGVVG